MLKIRFSTTILLLFVLSSCSSATLHKAEFELIILKESWLDLNLGYEGEPAQAKLKLADTSDPVFVVTEDQIEYYDWDSQKITLTQVATDKLGKSLSDLGAAEPSEIVKLQDLKENLGWGNPIERALYIHPFIVKVDNEFRYGGIFLDAPSQMGIDFPVARVTIENGKAVIAILPTHIPFVMIDPIDGNGNVRDSAIAQEATNDVEQLNVFSDWSIGIATSETAAKFREIIRNEEIRLAIGTVGR